MSQDDDSVYDYSYESEYSQVQEDVKEGSLDFSQSTDYEMTEEEKKELCKAFVLLDKDGDGVIEPSELGKLLIRWGRMDINEDLEDIMSYADAKGCEGAIGMDFNRFRRYIEKHLINTSDEDELRQAFEVFDSDPLTGKLNLTELRHYLKNKGLKLTDDEIDFLFREEDYWMLEEKNIFEYKELINKLLGKPYESPFLKCS